MANKRNKNKKNKSKNAIANIVKLDEAVGKNMRHHYLHLTSNVKSEDIPGLTENEVKEFVLSIFDTYSIYMSNLYMVEAVVDPDIASMFLKLNINRNRHLSSVHVDRFSNAMELGQYHPTGNPILFDLEENMCDGQHRLNAVIKYGKPIRLQLGYGATPEQIQCVDSGRCRNLVDKAKMAGLDPTPLPKKVESVRAHLAKIYCFYEQGFEEFVRRKGHSRVDETPFVIDYIRNHLQSTTEAAIETYKMGEFGTPSLLGFCYYTIVKKYGDVGREFFKQLFTGANLEEGSPILALSKKLTNLRNSNEKMEYKGKTTVRYIFQAFKEYRNGSDGFKKSFRWKQSKVNTLKIVNDSLA